MFRGMETHSYSRPSLLNIKGKLTVIGDGYHNIGPGIKLTIGKKGEIIIGNNFFVSYNAKFHVYKKVVIGNNNMWSHDIVIRDTDGHQILNTNDEIINPNREVIIGNHVWLGYHTRILKGVTIPDDNIIGANSIISKPLEGSGCIFVGNGRKVKEGVYWKRDSMENID